MKEHLKNQIEEIYEIKKDMQELRKVDANHAIEIAHMKGFIEGCERGYNRGFTHAIAFFTIAITLVGVLLRALFKERVPTKNHMLYTSF